MARNIKDVDMMVWHVGNRIHKLRTKEGLSQLRLAALLGLRAQNSVANWECGKCYPCVMTIIKICQLFGVSADWLLFGKGEGPKGVPMLDIKEYLKQTKTVLVTQDAFDELVKKASAQPERKTWKGRWNVYYHGEENGKSIFSYSCNQCGYSAPYNLIGGVYEQRKWNFCPNCGADMREEVQE